MTVHSTARPWLLIACTLLAATLLTPAPSAHAVQLYYADNDLSTVSRMAANGSDQQLLVNTQRALLGLELDRAAGKMYWSDNGPAFDSNARAGIYRSNLDGTGKETLFTATLPPIQQTAKALTIDPAGQKIYWIEGGTGIRSMNYDGTGVQTLLAAPNIGTAIEIDAASGQLYFTTGTFDAHTTQIERVDLSGGNRAVIAAVEAYSLALDVANQQIYAADWFNHKIMRVGYDGTGIQQIAQAHAIRDVQVYEGQLYYPNVRSEAVDNTGPYHFQWVRSDLDGSNPEVLWDVPRAAGPRDMIQFAIVPELSSLSLLVAGSAAFGLGALVRVTKKHRPRRGRLPSEAPAGLIASRQVGPARAE